MLGYRGPYQDACSISRHHGDDLPPTRSLDLWEHAQKRAPSAETRRRSVPSPTPGLSPSSSSPGKRKAWSGS
ncbi:hypothetical protein ANANG_G00186840 [Anguilla anguilla]|uniref:Uncharacterized protein n=1 Tax=Anguilla anguilla TaxID=7936 RepID=A0A9D3RUS1_ANGAN|nr:hypothetical protein ANANG_G00186840 [Anguilla anguilla]